MKDEYDFSKARQGSVLSRTGKTRITIYLDDDVIDAFRDRSEQLGKGYQTLINEALRESLRKTTQPLTAKTLRRIIREELARTG